MGRASPSRPASPYANIFHIGKDGTRAECIQKFKTWLPTQPDLMANLHQLKGLRLGCFCKPLACHVDVIVELLEGPVIESPPPQRDLFD